MRRLKKFDELNELDEFGREEYIDDDEYLESPEYFVETYYNGQFKQLREMLTNFRGQQRMDELLNYINELGEQKIADWIARN